jgi:sigma-B regulation protein RsbU (phosphoserine phosphatase)
LIGQRVSPAADPRVEQLRKLFDINRAFSYTTSHDEVARLTCERGADLLDASAAVLMLQDADGLLHVRATHGIDDARVVRFSAPFGDALIARLQGLLAARDEWFIAVPLVVGGAVIGLLAVSLSRPADDPDEWLLSALADQAAVALENARLGGEVRLEMEGRLRASEGATNAKDRALATLAHDIRSPLGAIEGYCNVLADGLYGPVTEKQREGLGRIRMSGRHLLSLLENVMDMARLSAGAMSVRAEAVRLADVASEAVHMLLPASYAKHQRLLMNATVDSVVTADAARLRQVLVNLIGNAVKFTPAEGTITVTTGSSASNGTRWGEIRITDTGPGISDADQVAIFEPYYRSEGTAMMPGIGLGLAISLALVRQMAGTIFVESRLGAGSSFVIHLPMASDGEKGTG